MYAYMHSAKIARGVLFGFLEGGSKFFENIPKMGQKIRPIPKKVRQTRDKL